MPHRRRTGNEVLDRMPAERRGELVRRAELFHLQKEHILAEPRHPSSKVFFPTTAVISVMLPLQMGQRVEAGTVGCEGVVGIPAILGRRPREIAIVQVPGEAYAVDASAVAPLLYDEQVGPAIAAYIGYAYTIAKQNGACNAFHGIAQRTARWLLTAQDRARRSEFPLTQELLSHMVGATRARVGEAALALRAAGVIDYRRGRMHIKDRRRLERLSCECYAATRWTPAGSG